jgi:hypothetical protein
MREGLYGEDRYEGTLRDEALNEATLSELLREVELVPGASPSVARVRAALEPGAPRLGLWGPAKGGRSTLLRALAGGAPVAAVAARACTPGEIWLRRGPAAAARPGARVEGPGALAAAAAWTDVDADPAALVEVWWPEAPDGLTLVELPADLDARSGAWARVDALLLVADAQQGLGMALLDAAAGLDPVVPLLGVILTRGDRLEAAPGSGAAAEARASARRRLRAWGGPEVPVWIWPPEAPGWTPPLPPPEQVAARRAAVARGALLELAGACRRERDACERRALEPSPAEALRWAGRAAIDAALGPAADAAARAVEEALPSIPAASAGDGDGQRLLALQRAAVALERSGPTAALEAWTAASAVLGAALRAAVDLPAVLRPPSGSPLGPPPAAEGPAAAEAPAGLARFGGWVAGAAAAGALAGVAAGGGVLLPAVLAGGVAAAAWGRGDPRPGLLREAEAWVAARRGAWSASARAAVEPRALRAAGESALEASLAPLDAAHAEAALRAAAEALRWADLGRRLAEAAPPSAPVGDGLGVDRAAPPPRSL